MPENRFCFVISRRNRAYCLVLVNLPRNAKFNVSVMSRVVTARNVYDAVVFSPALDLARVSPGKALDQDAFGFSDHRAVVFAGLFLDPALQALQAIFAHIQRDVDGQGGGRRPGARAV